MPDDFSKLVEAGIWLEWLGANPSATLRRHVERLLQEQVEGSVVRSFRVTDAPRFLTAGRPVEDGAGQVAVTRAALATPFELQVSAPDGQLHDLRGVFSWVSSGLDGTGRTDRTFLDLDAELDWAAKELQQRLEAPVTSTPKSAPQTPA
jgi:hypothetical protein